MKTWLTIPILVIFTLTCFAQDSTRAFKIMVCPTQFLFCDFPVTLEKVVNRNAIGLTLAFKPATQASGNVNLQGFGMILNSYDVQNYFNSFENAATIQLSGKHYFLNHPKIFVEGDLFYRHWWLNNKQVESQNVEPSDESFNGTRTESQNVYGLKLLLGKSYVFMAGHKVKLVLDYYGGVGERFKTHVYETTGSIGFPPTNGYDIERGHDWLFSVQAGIKLGFALGHFGEGYTKMKKGNGFKKLLQFKQPENHY